MWYCVPEEDLEKFEKACKKKIAGLVRKDPNILLDMVTMISPAYLVQNGVSPHFIHNKLNRYGCTKHSSKRVSLSLHYLDLTMLALVQA